MTKSKRESTRDALIAAAEHLFGTKGFDRVATREILELAGQKNQSALQYHFGDRAGLIWAVVDARVAKIEVRRKKMMEKMPPAGEETPEELIEAFVRPLTEVVLEDDQGSAYVQFVIQTSHRPGGDMLETVEGGRYASLEEVSTRLDAKLAHLDPLERPLRKRLIFNALVGALSIWDRTEKDTIGMEHFIATAVATTVPFLMLPGFLAKSTSE